MNTRTEIPAAASPERASGKRLEDLAWAVFLIMTGVLWLMPADRVPDGAWLIGTGILLLGLNVARQLVGVATSGFTLLLGALALAGGVAEWMGVELPLMAVALIVFGASIVVKPLFTAKK